MKAERLARSWAPRILLLTGLVGLQTLFSPGSAFAAPGDLDTTFGTGGVATANYNNGTSHTDEANAVAIQPDGKIVVASTNVAPLPPPPFLPPPDHKIVVSRFNANGTVDTSFGSTGTSDPSRGLVYAPGTVTYNPTALSEIPRGLAIQTDGKIVLAGTINQDFFGAQVGDFLTMRFNANGVLDSSFGSSSSTYGAGVVNDHIGAPCTTIFPGSTTPTTFSADGARDVLINPLNGKILVGGAATADMGLIQYNANGTKDTSFGGGDGVVTASIASCIADQVDASGADHIFAMRKRLNGKIVVSGLTNGSLALGASDLMVGQFNADGSVDTSFGTNGFSTLDTGAVADAEVGHSLDLANDGKFVVSGGTSIFAQPGAQALVARYNSNGTLDNSFDSDGVKLIDLPANPNKSPFGADSFRSVEVAPISDKIVLSGFSGEIGFSNTPGDLAVVRLNPNGSFDTSFGGGDGIVLTDIKNKHVNDVGIQAKARFIDQRLFVVGRHGSGAESDIAILKFKLN